VGKDGSLVGFGGGLEMKKRLLDVEASGQMGGNS
jgi:O6-methylguanine-DNA--protein-cysteine methyltransferase